VGENKTTVKGFFGEPLGGLNTTGAGSNLGSANGMLSNPGTSTGGAASPTNCTVSGGSPLSAGFAGATTSCPTTGTTGTSSSSPGSGGIGQVMGVGTSKTGGSILNPNQQTTYDTWEFIYDPKIELLYQQANLFGGGTTGGVNSQSIDSLGSGQSNPKGGSTNLPTAPPPSTNPSSQ
jgi:hypothetical protein